MIRGWLRLVAGPRAAQWLKFGRLFSQRAAVAAQGSFRLRGRRADLGEGRLDHPAPRAKRTLRWSMMRVMCEWMLAFMLTLGFAIGVAQHVGHGFCEMLRESFAGVVAAF